MNEREATFHNLELTVHTLAKAVPPPQLIEQQGHTYVRYTERMIQQAIVLKLARYVSTLRAAALLSDAGFIQEQGMLHRILDETTEDIDFLSLSLIFGNATERHQKFLANFWMEEYDSELCQGTRQERAMVPRDKIRAYIANTTSHDPSGAITAAKEVYKTYSGFVHGAAPHIIDLYDPREGRFVLNGLRRSDLHLDHTIDFRNVLYRGILNCGIAAKALGHENMFQQAYDYAKQFDEAFQMTGNLKKAP